MPLKKRPGQHPVPIVIGPGDGSGADALARLLHLERTEPVPPAARAATPLFRGAAGGPPTTHEISAWARDAARAGGSVDPSQVSGRSLRIGGATELHALGVTPATIQALGRWAGDTQRIYTRMPVGRAVALSARVSSAPHDPTLEDAFAEYTQSRAR